MPLQTYLMEGEKIIAQCGDFYASNKRLIRYQKHLFGEEVDDIPYAHLTSVGVARKPRRGLIRAGVVVIVTFLSSLLMLAIISPILKSLSGLLGGSFGLNLGPLVPIHLIALGAGVAMVLAGVFVPSVFVQFRAPGLNKDAEARFRLHGGGRGASLDLVRIVREQSLLKESALTDVRPAEDKGNQKPAQ
ncbi:MAG: hypothetical protein HY671_02290 [Chloroflexi bacterium]|nr:hypothetical protein [Chloroflexota bacterium]